MGEHDFGGRLRGAMTAHPRIDPRTGELVCFAYSLFAPYLHYFVVDASRRAGALGRPRPAGAVLDNFFAGGSIDAVAFDDEAIWDLAFLTVVALEFSAP